MTVLQSFSHICASLQSIYPKGEAESIGYMVLEHYCGIKRSELKWKGEQVVEEGTEKKLQQVLQELMTHRPVQYVLGNAWFYEMPFYVNEAVLIPRPETEELVHWIVNTHANTRGDIKILEVGTGSGCIAIALKRSLHNAQVTAVDISEAALQVAKHNAEKNHADIRFLHCDFLQQANWNALGNFDIIVSNPPYIPLQEKEKLDANVAAWEPGSALFVPNDDPLLFYKCIAAFGRQYLTGHREVFAECHQDYALATQAAFETAGYETELKKDFFDNNRMLRAAFNR